MTLNASGPLSFGGSTTGQSINLELGVSATALASIDSTAFRKLAGVLSGQISVSNFYGKSNATGFVAYVGDYTAYAFQYGSGINVTPSGNLVLIATFGVDQHGIFVITSSTAPTAVVQARYVGLYNIPVTEQNNGTASPAIDSSGNIYCANSYSAEKAVWFKTDSSLNSSTPTYQYANIPGGWPTYNFTSSANTLIDSSGNIIVGYSNRVEWGCCQSPQAALFVGKFNAAGSSATWFKTTGNAATQGSPAWQITGMALDSGQNVWVSGLRGVFRYTASNGDTSLGFEGSGTQFSSIAIDGSDNKYLTSISSSTSNTYKFNLMKVDASRNIVWAKSLVNGTLGGNPKRVIVGGDGFIYVVGSVLISSDPIRYGIVVKYNSSGVLQWQRIIYNASPYSGIQQFAGLVDCVYTANGLAVTGAMYKSTNNTSTVTFVALLPLDGSGTGSYTVAGSNVTYAASSYTDATDSSVYLGGLGIGNQNAEASTNYTFTKSTTAYSVVSASV